MIGIGVWGAGRHGARYLRHLAAGDVAGARAVGFGRRDREAAAALERETGVAAVGSLDELLSRPGLDAVVVATPPGLHRAEVQQVVAAGSHALVEKPLCGTLADALALAAELGAAADRVTVAQTLRFDPTLVALRERLGTIGPLHRLRGAMRLEPSPLAWQRDPALAGGGSVTLTGIHLFDLYRWLVGRSPDSAVASQLSVDHPLENAFDACFHWEREAVLAGAEVSKFAPLRDMRVEAIGERGALIADPREGWLESATGHARRRVAAPGAQPTLPPTLEAFARHLRGEAPNPVPLAAGIEAVRMAEACYRSQRTGARVALDDTRE